MFIRYFYNRDEEKPYRFNGVYEDVESESSFTIRYNFINSLARPDLQYNFNFVPIYMQDGDDKYSGSSASIYVDNFLINGKRVNFLPTTGGISLSLKPGKYNFKVEYVIHDLFVTRENRGRIGYYNTHTYSSRINERKTLELNDVYINETTEYCLCLLIKAVPIFKKVYDRRNVHVGYEFDRWIRETKFYLADKNSLLECCSDGLVASIHPHHYPINRDYSYSLFSNDRYEITSKGASNPTFNLPYKVEKNVFKSGNYYYGPYVNGKKDSLGFKYEDGNYYFLRYLWNEERSKGYGSHYYKNGEIAFGYTILDSLNGECMYFYPNGDCQLLFYDDGKPVGESIYFYKNGDYDSCTYKDGKKRFLPERKNPSSIVLFDDCVTGKRKLEFNRIVDNNGIFCGQINNGSSHGVGTINYKDGSRYCGYFSYGKLNGIGTYYYPNGTYIHGYWKDGNLNGQCRVYFSNGTIEDRYYENNKYIKKYWFDKEVINNSSSSLKTTTSSNISKNTSNISSSSKPNSSTSQETNKPSFNKNIKTKYADGSTYEGEINESYNYHGKGKYTWTSGDCYDGEWKNGVKTGKGKFVFSNGDVYNGSWLNNEFDGIGTYIWKGGETYIGDWVKSKRTGKGDYRFENGNRYVGDFVENKKHGEGTYYYANGEKYVGQFKEDLRHGEGILYDKTGKAIKSGKWIKGEFDDPNKLRHNITFENAKIGSNETVLTYDICKYVGIVKNGLPHLIGTYYYYDGRVYSGCFNNGKRENFGTFINRNATRYIGEFIDGNYEGFGISFEKDNYISAGLYKNDKKHGITFVIKHKECTIYLMNNGKLSNILHRDYKFNANIKMDLPKIPIVFNYFDEDLYIGELDENGMNGYGKLLMDGGASYVGSFKNNDFHGLGCYYFKNGDIYIGQFENSCFNGLGARIYTNGTIVIGEYKDDELINRIY